MTALIGIFILVLLIMGLVSRKRRTKTWIKEERYEESGHWLDKRPGERGTWGSLDQEMARERGQMVWQGRIVELAGLIRQHAARLDPAFGSLPEDQNQTFRSYTRDQATRMIVLIEQVSQGKVPTAAPVTDAGRSEDLKKRILDFAYHHYPALLDLDIDTIRQFDLLAASWSETVVSALEKLKT